MTRDHRKLRVFVSADALTIEIYKKTRAFPADERYGLQAQLRRAAISVSANIVEGSAKRTTAEYCRFLDIAAGSLAELRYLADLATRLGYLSDNVGSSLERKARPLAASLERLIRALSPSSATEASKPHPEP
jgi:four helix bundle protein